MNKSKLYGYIKDLGVSFKSDAARKDLYNFSIKQFKLLSDTSKIISKVDPINNNVLDNVILHEYVNNSIDIINRYKIVCDECFNVRQKLSNGRLTQDLSNSSGIASYNPSCDQWKFSNFQRSIQDSLLSFLIATSVHGGLYNMEDVLIRLLPMVDLTFCQPSSVLALIGALHKSGVSTLECVEQFIHKTLEYILKRRKLYGKLSLLETSLLFWHKCSLVFMYLYPFNHIQAKILIHSTYLSMKEITNEVNRRGATTELKNLVYSGKDNSPPEPHSRGDNKLLDVFFACYRNMTQALHILVLIQDLDKFNLKTLNMLNEMLEPRAWSEITAPGTTPSDIHTKVTFTFRQVLDPQKYSYKHEVSVGNTAYTIDTLITLKC